MESASDRPQWTVWRQDDNGHRFVVAHHDDRQAAEAQAANSVQAQPCFGRRLG